MSHHERTVVIVVNAIRPYVYELNNVLCLPVGAAYRCRYSHKYVKLSAIADVIAARALLVVRDFATAALVPLRYATITHVHEVGDFVHMTYQVGDYVCHPEGRQAYAQLGERFNALLMNEIVSANRPGDDLTQLVFEVEAVPSVYPSRATDGRSDDQLWGATLEIFRDIPVCRNLDFLKIHSLRDDQGEKVQYVADNGYALRPGSSYELEVLQHTYAGGQGDSGVQGNRLLRLDLGASDLVAQRGAIPVAGRYDLLSFRFSVDDYAKTRTHQLLLSIDPAFREVSAGPGGTTSFVGPIPDILLAARVAPTFLQSTRSKLAIFVSIVALLVYFVPSTVKLVGPDHLAGSAGKIGLVVFILLNSGGFTNAVASVGRQGKLNP